MKRWTANWDALRQKIEREIQQRKKRRILLEELDRLRASYQEDTQRYEADVHELLLQRLKAERYMFHQKMLKEIMVVQRNADEENTFLWRQFEKLQNQHQVQVSVSYELSTKFKKMVKEIHEERKEKRIFLEELDRIRASYQEDIQKYEADVLTARQQADHLQGELDKAIKAHAEGVSSHQLMVKKARGELDVLRQKMVKEITAVQKNADEQNILLLRQFEKLQNQHNIQVTVNPELSIKLKKMAKEIQMERRDKRLLQEELSRLRASFQEEMGKYKAEVFTARQQVDHLQRELEKSIKDHADSMSNHQLMMQNVRTEWDRLHQKMVKEVTVVQKNADEENSLLWKQFDNLQSQHSTLVSVNLELSKRIKKMAKVVQVEREEKRIFQEELDRVRASHLTLQCELKTIQLQKKFKKSKLKKKREENWSLQGTVTSNFMSEVPKGFAENKKSLWQRLKDCLGLRRRQSDEVKGPCGNSLSLALWRP